MHLGNSGRFTFDFPVPRHGDLDDNDVDDDNLQLIEPSAGAAAGERDERIRHIRLFALGASTLGALVLYALSRVVIS